jgi:hypothetical protein
VKKRKTAREIADEVMTADEAKNFAKDPKLIDLENRAIKALQRTRNYLLEGLSDEEYKDVGEDGIEELAGDCFLEQYGERQRGVSLVLEPDTRGARRVDEPGL